MMISSIKFQSNDQFCLLSVCILSKKNFLNLTSMMVEDQEEEEENNRKEAAINRNRSNCLGQMFSKQF